MAHPSLLRTLCLSQAPLKKSNAKKPKAEEEAAAEGGDIDCTVSGTRTAPRTLCALPPARHVRATHFSSAHIKC